jgi:hypothetical protein
MDKLLTSKDLSERWQVTERTINDYKNQGIITPVKGIPCVRYNPSDITKLEGIKLEPFSPLEKRKLERQLDEVTKERDMLRGVLTSILAESTKVVGIMNKIQA